MDLNGTNVHFWEQSCVPILGGGLKCTFWWKCILTQKEINVVLSTVKTTFVASWWFIYFEAKLLLEMHVLHNSLLYNPITSTRPSIISRSAPFLCKTNHFYLNWTQLCPKVTLFSPILIQMGLFAIQIPCIIGSWALSIDPMTLTNRSQDLGINFLNHQESFFFSGINFLTTETLFNTI